jgi:ribosomal-protein-alanine N-acetyltransferase
VSQSQVETYAFIFLPKYFYLQDVFLTNMMSSDLLRAIKFRPMKLEDIPRVHAIDVLSFSMPWPEKSYQFELTQNPTTLAIVAELNQPEMNPLVVGMAVVWMIIDEAHIATVAIHPDYRGRGLGKHLLEETLRLCIRRGAILATLEVREGNQVAQEMYKKFGFKVVGRRPHYYADKNEDAILMTLRGLSIHYLSGIANKVQEHN